MTVAYLTLSRLQDADDFGSTPGAGNDGYALTWDNGAGEFVLAAAGVTDHGALTGLSDDDHSQYLLATGARTGASSQAQTFTNGIIGPSWKPASDSTAALRLQTSGGADVVTLDTTAGYVGIGTTAPASLLEINGDVATLRIADDVTRTPTVDFIRGTGAYGSDSYGDWRVQNSTAKLNFAHASNTVPSRTAITLDGSTSEADGIYTGIGTTTPATRLDVYGSALPVLRVTRETAATNEFTSVQSMVAKSSSDAADGLGVGLLFALQDNTQTTDAYLASFGAVRNGADNTGSLVFNTYLAGSLGERMRVTSVGRLGIGTTSPATMLHAVSTAATTNAVRDVLTLGTDVTSTGVGAAGLGAAIKFNAESTTTAGTAQAAIEASWIVATHASRTARLALSAYDYNGAREGVRIDTNGSAALLGFYGHAATAQQTLATGAGASADDIITALQNLGLVKQS